MAAQVAAGIETMLKAENPQLSPNQIEYILETIATDIMFRGKD